MLNTELLKIIEKIKQREELSLTEIAAKTVVDRANLSTLINMEEERVVSKGMLRKFKAVFPSYFEESNKDNKDKTENATLDNDILFILAESNRKLAEAHKELSESNKILARSHEVLINKITGGVDQEIPANVEQKFSDFLAIIRKVQSGEPIDVELGRFWTAEKS